MPLNKVAVSQLRAEFPALQQTAAGRPLIFLDGPGGTQAHGSVIEAMSRYLTEANSNAHGAFLYSRRTDETVITARRALVDLLNASRPDEIVFGPNMTTLTFNVSRAIGRALFPATKSSSPGWTTTPTSRPGWRYKIKSPSSATLISTLPTAS